jgi:membrane-bound lytic murein transglycosylase D
MTIPAAAPKAAQLAPEAPATETPAVIENNPPRTLPSTGSQIHTVKQGETLTKIAMAYGTTVQELARVNTLKSTKEIAVGQVLNIPDKNSMPPQPTATERKTESVKTMPPKVTQPVTAKTPVAPVAAATTSYVVKKGDSPLKIAREHNITYDELAKVNKKMNPANLQPGQTLLIPRKK